MQPVTRAPHPPSFLRLCLAITASAMTLTLAAPMATAADPAPPPAEWEKYATPKADTIIVYKGERRLELRRGGILLRSYHVALGHHPAGPKLQEGDGRTPEGSYIIDRRKLESDYHLALHISYPDDRDRQRAAQRGVSPGGNIMIHGLPGYMIPAAIKKLPPDWTNGCIALSNEDMNEVWRLVDDGVTVDIYP
jgi:murein L,D-transpeptidase YafK